MYLIKCSNCGYEINSENQILLYGGEKVASKLAVDFINCKNLGEKKRRAAQIFNEFGVKCPRCKKTDIWTWL